MELLLSPDQNYCCFHNNIIYEAIHLHSLRPCGVCSECDFNDMCWNGRKIEPLCVPPCSPMERIDNEHVIWKKSHSVDYQGFMKMLDRKG